MPRPRTHKIKIPNLYAKLDKRTTKTYYQYKDSRTGKFHGLGTDKARAEIVATELNSRISAQLVDQYSYLLDTNPTKTKLKGLTVGTFCKTYLGIQKKRLDENEIVIHTYKAKNDSIKILNERCKTINLKELDTKTLASILDEYKDQGKARKAQVLRSNWIDLFKEAQHLGEVDSGFNPALSTKPVKVIVKRERLIADHWVRIFNIVKEIAPEYATNSMLIAMTTGLRREDICALKFKDIKDGYLHVATSKSRRKTKLAFPMDLKNELVGMSLGEIISKCRSTGVVSKYIIHQSDLVKNAKLGEYVNVDSLTRWFTDSRNKTGLKWKGMPPTFHEQRSLAERILKRQGVDTQSLLGHKNSKTTDIYDDNRGAEYIYIKAENSK